MNIWKERQSEYGEIYNVVKMAFESSEHSDGNEHNLVNALRKSSAYIPNLSLTAKEGNNIIGYIMFTEIKIGESTAIALAPLAVLPKHQKKGVGQALINEGHKIAKEMGYICSVVLGSEKYYPKFGYVEACKYGIKPPFDVPSKNFMVYDLQGNLKQLNGVVEYAEEFFEF